MQRLRSVAEFLRWSPLDVAARRVRMFSPPGPHQRLVEIRPSFTPKVEAHMDEVARVPRDYLDHLLRDVRPIGYDFKHDAVSLLATDSNARLSDLLDCYAPDRHSIARGIRQALPEHLEDRARELEELEKASASGTDPALRALRESFRLAELSWALGLESAGASRSIPVVVAAIEACSTIGGALLELTPEEGEPLDEDMLKRIHHARMAWIGVLLRYDVHADLVAEGGERLNDRLRWLIGRAHDPLRGRVSSFVHLFEEDPVPLVGRRLRRLVPTAGQGEGPDPGLRTVEMVEKEEEHRFLDVAARLLLPRYMIDESVGLLQHLGTNGLPGHRGTERGVRWYGRWALPLVPAAIAGMILLVVALLMVFQGFSERFTSASAGSMVESILPGGDTSIMGISQGVWYALWVLAGLWVGLSVFALYRRGRSASYLLILRVPSATAFGLAILLALSFAWIGTQSGLGRFGPMVALIAAFAYSAVEFINQGGDSRSAIAPAFVLTLLAGGMSLMVATMILGVFGRTLLTQVPNYAMLADPTIQLQTLAILASISLALGTFLQAIWDEQTITAPLSHLRLRG
jgi:hypothetical protein